MRYLIVLLAGAVIGASMALAAAHALQKRGAYPLGVMAAMQHHLGRLREDLGAPDCTPARPLARMERLAALAPEIDSAFAGRGHDEDFTRRAAAFEAALSKHLAEPPADCRALDAAWREVSDSCEACHLRHR